MHKAGPPLLAGGEIEPAVARLLEEARAAISNRRTAERLPFYCPAVIQLQDEQRTIAGFTRDLSAQGVGLLHLEPLQLGNVVVVIEAARSVTLPVGITWCDPCGQDWYLSGGIFLT